MPSSPVVSALACWLLLAAGCAHSNPWRKFPESGVSVPQPVTERPSSAPMGAYAADAAHRLDAPVETPSLRDQLRGVQDPSRNVDLGCSLNEAIAGAMRNSTVVRVVNGVGGTASAARITGYDVEAEQARAEAALAAFDATTSAYFNSARFRQPPNSFFGPGLSNPLLRDEMLYGIGVKKPFRTGGSASLFYDPLPSYLFLPGSTSGYNPSHVSALTLVLSQPLLKGAGRKVNNAPLQIAQIRAEQTAWDFKQEVMESCFNVATAYWDLHAAQAALRAVSDMLPLLEETVSLQQKLFEAERVIEADVGKAVAQLHEYRQERARLQSEVQRKELLLRNLMGLPPADGLNLIPISMPTRDIVEIDTDVALQLALTNHPNLVRQSLNIVIREKELFVAQNGLLPQLDFESLYRLNGLGENLGDALEQMATAAYSDWQLGASFSVPLGRRQAFANVRTAEMKVSRERVLFEQETLTRAHDLGDVLRKIRLDHEQYREANLRLQAAEKWLQGARIRYLNPLPNDDRQNLLLQYINDYLAAMRFRTNAATEVEVLLARYNADLVELEKVQGTILAQYGVELTYDPCRQLKTLENLRSHPPQSPHDPPPPAPPHASPEPLPPGKNEADPTDGRITRLPPAQ